MELELNEVIENLKYLVSDSCTDTQFDYLEEIEIATKALEKQIPRKPYYEGDGYADRELVYDYAKCPMCGHEFEYDINDWGCNYCSDCGQKLDWGDDEE